MSDCMLNPSYPIKMTVIPLTLFAIFPNKFPTCNIRVEGSIPGTDSTSISFWRILFTLLLLEESNLWLLFPLNETFWVDWVQEACLEVRFWFVFTSFDRFFTCSWNGKLVLELWWAAESVSLSALLLIPLGPCWPPLIEVNWRTPFLYWSTVCEGMGGCFLYGLLPLEAAKNGWEE